MNAELFERFYGNKLTEENLAGKVWNATGGKVVQGIKDTAGKAVQTVKDNAGKVVGGLATAAIGGKMMYDAVTKDPQDEKDPEKLKQQKDLLQKTLDSQLQFDVKNLEQKAKQTKSDYAQRVLTQVGPIANQNLNNTKK